MEFLVDSLESTHIRAELITVVVNSAKEIHEASLGLNGQTVLGFDCEGVDFGRPGKVCLVQLSTRTRCYLFDVLDKEKVSSVILLLKSILENPVVTKIIHDCKMDSDALYHLCDIKLCNCHDTQVWDTILFSRGTGNNLNRTLTENNCTVNNARDPTAYQRNNAFWVRRPLTKQMIAWATGDVGSLFELYDKQIALATDKQVVQCKIESEQSETFLRECILHKANVKSMSHLLGSGVLSYMKHIVPGTHCQPRGKDTLWIYGISEEAIQRVLTRIDDYID